MDISERLKYFLEKEKENPSSLSKKIGMSQTSINSAINGRNLPGTRLLLAIKEYKPNVDMNWFLFGHGSMLLGSQDIKQEVIEEYKDNTRILKEMIQYKDKEIEALKKELEALKENK